MSEDREALAWLASSLDMTVAQVVAHHEDGRRIAERIASNEGITVAQVVEG
jgi:hypothetical protein